MHAKDWADSREERASFLAPYTRPPTSRPPWFALEIFHARPTQATLMWLYSETKFILAPAITNFYYNSRSLVGSISAVSRVRSLILPSSSFAGMSAGWFSRTAASNRAYALAVPRGPEGALSH